MDKFWRDAIKPAAVEIVSPEGNVRSSSTAYFSGKMAIIDDMDVDIRPGDELRRRLPNGNDEVWNVDDPALFDTDMVAPHYQVALSRPQIHGHRQGGYFHISVTGPNSRVNINSHDASTNVVQANPVFTQARDILTNSSIDASQKTAIGADIDAMEQANTQSGFKAAYDRFVGSAADHLALFAPVLPALTGALLSFGS